MSLKGESAGQVEGELVSRKRLEDLAPEQFSSHPHPGRRVRNLQLWRCRSGTPPAPLLVPCLPLHMCAALADCAVHDLSMHDNVNQDACCLHAMQELWHRHKPHSLCVQASQDSDSRNLATLLLLRDLQSKRMGSEAALRKAESVGDGRIRPRAIQPLPGHCTLLCSLAFIVRSVPCGHGQVITGMSL